MTSKEAAHSLYEELTKGGFPSWLAGIGHGSDVICVYVVAKDGLRFVPEEWEGHKINVTVSGKFTIQGPKDE